MTYLAKLRNWTINKLGGVKRDECAKFCYEFLKSNGSALAVITSDGVVINGETFICKEGETAIAIAPWARNTTISNCLVRGASN